MPTVEVYNVKGEQVGEIELSDAIFAAEVNESLLFDVSQMLLAARRRGTASTRTAVSARGGRKPWRQKGQEGHATGVFVHRSGRAVVLFSAPNRANIAIGFPKKSGVPLSIQP